MISIFSKSEPIPQSAPQLTIEDQLAGALAEFRRAEREFLDRCLAIARYNGKRQDLRTAIFNGGLAYAVNAMSRDRVLAELERRRGRALVVRNEALHRWSEVKVAVEKSGG